MEDRDFYLQFRQSCPPTVRGGIASPGLVIKAEYTRPGIGREQVGREFTSPGMGPAGPAPEPRAAAPQEKPQAAPQERSRATAPQPSGWQPRAPRQGGSLGTTQPAAVSDKGDDVPTATPAEKTPREVKPPWAVNVQGMSSTARRLGHSASDPSGAGGVGITLTAADRATSEAHGLLNQRTDPIVEAARQRREAHVQQEAQASKLRGEGGGIPTHPTPQPVGGSMPQSAMHRSIPPVRPGIRRLGNG